MEDRIWWLGFSQMPNVGPGRFKKLLAHFGTAKAAWNANEKDLVAVIKPALTTQFLNFRKTFDPHQYEARLRHKTCWYLTLNDPNYPSLLKQIKNPPFVLFYRGNEKVLNTQNVIPAKAEGAFGTGIQKLDSRFHGNDIYESTAFVGVVGTRKITDYGKHVTEMLTQELVAAGCVIVSGLALGVDAVAHVTTLQAKGKTIAVLGCGIDCCSPTENALLYDSIVENGGVIVSEYGLGMSPTIGSFPSRNRIIAGLSLGVLVTEGAADSGALITAKDAFTVGRKVFAVPGPVTSSLSKGPYDLIKKGAVVVSSGKEILDELGLEGVKGLRKVTKVRGDTKEEQQVLDLLSEQDLRFDDLVERTNIDSQELGTILSLMEMKGMIHTLSAGFFGLTAI